MTGLEVVILVGLQAAGKSSFYRARLGGTHVQVSKDLFPNVRNKAKRQREEIEAALGAGRNVAVDNTNVTRAHRADIVEISRSWGAQVICYFFESVLQDCLTRNAARSGKARVPDVAIRVAARLLESPERTEGFDALWRVRLAEGGGFLIAPG